MKTSIFLAKVIGWYLVIMGLVVLLRQQVMHAALTNIAVQPSLMFFIALISLMLGLLLVISHNIWVKGWPVIITIIAWLVLLSGLVRVAFPEAVIKGAEWWMHNPTYLLFFGAFYIIIGFYLLYKGYRSKA